MLIQPLFSLIDNSPNVDFCGYSLPHPSEAKMHFRIQTTGKSDRLIKGSKEETAKEPHFFIFRQDNSH